MPVAIAVGTPLARPLSACQICVPIPTKSAADFLIGADVVVLARENPDKPFSLRAEEVLKGTLADPSIDLFLDSASRRILAANPDRLVVCVHGATEEEPGEWRRIGMTTAAFGSLVREIVARAADWQREPAQRVAFFSSLLGHDDDQVRTLAHLEVGKAPYDEIRRLGREGVLSRDAILAFLDDFRMTEWHALYILMLAQTGDPRDHERIRESVRSAQRFGITSQIAAWATAWIEIDGESALEALAGWYLRNPDRKPEEVRAVLAALSVHGTDGHVDLRERIGEAYRELLAIHPAMAPSILGDLTTWERRDFVEPLAAILASPPPELDALDVMRLRAYARQAVQDGGTGRAAAEPTGIPDLEGTAPRRSGLLLALACLMMLPIVLLVGSRRNRRLPGSPLATRGHASNDA